MTADQLKALLGLEPLAFEGGFYAETYRSTLRLPAEAFGLDRAGVRSIATAIYYLLTPGTFSAIHRLACDEIFHFYLGDPVELLLLPAGGTAQVVVLGTDLPAGMRPQAVVPQGVWQGARLVKGGAFALLGTTVAPGFDLADFELADRALLVASHPGAREWVEALTRRATA